MLNVKLLVFSAGNGLEIRDSLLNLSTASRLQELQSLYSIHEAICVQVPLLSKLNIAHHPHLNITRAFTIASTDTRKFNDKNFPVSEAKILAILGAVFAKFQVSQLKYLYTIHGRNHSNETKCIYSMRLTTTKRTEGV